MISLKFSEGISIFTAPAVARPFVIIVRQNPDVLAKIGAFELGFA